MLPPPRAWIVARPGHAKPQCFDDSRDSKNDSISVRDAKYNAAGAMHRVAWALQNSKAIGQKCVKPWENQGFAAERTGTELLDVFAMFFWKFERC